MVFVLSQVDATLAGKVAEGLGIEVPKKLDAPLNMSIPADGKAKDFQPQPIKQPVGKSPALSMANTPKDSIRTRKVAVLAADGVDSAALAAMKKALEGEGAQAKIIAPRLGFLKGTDGKEIKIDFSLLTAASVLFDAVYVPGGERSVAALKAEADAIHFVNEAYKHCKAVAASGAGVEFLRATALADIVGKSKGKENQVSANDGVVTGAGAQTGKVAAEFIKAMMQHRFWSREKKDRVPA